MNTFIKDNWFKLGIIIILSIAVLSVAYYFVIFIPQKEGAKTEQQKQEQLIKDQEKELEQQEKCREAGTKAYNDYKRNNSLSTGYFFDPEFYFNKTLQLCLYSGGYSRTGYWERWVKNSFTNATIIMTYNFSDGIIDFDKPADEVASKRIQNFWDKYEELFGR